MNPIPTEIQFKTNLLNSINTQPVKYEAPSTFTEPRASSLTVQPTRLVYEQLNETYPQVKKEEIPTSAVSSQPVVTAVDFSIVKDEYNYNYQVDQNKHKRKAEDDASFEEPQAKKNKLNSTLNILIIVNSNIFINFQFL